MGRLLLMCPDCQIPMQLVLTPKFGWRYLCPTQGCDIRHSCHQRSKEPMGKPADRLTRRARASAHEVFDKIWNNGSRKKRGKARKAAYTWLADELGLSERDCHIGKFNYDTCMQVCKLAMHMNFDKLRELGFV